MEHYVRFVLRHRIKVIIVVLFVTSLSCVALTQGTIASSINKMFFNNSTEYVHYQKQSAKLGNDQLFFVAYPDPSPLSPLSIQRLRKVIRQIEKLPEVARTESILNAQLATNHGYGLSKTYYTTQALARPNQTEALRNQLRSDPLYSGIIISDDGKHASVLVELSVVPDRRAETIPKVINDVLRAFRSHGFSSDELRISGFGTLLMEVIGQTINNLFRLLPVTGILLFAVVFLLFRSLAPALLALGVSLLADIWMLACGILIDRQLSFFMSVVPIVVMIIAFSDVIHLWSAYMVERRRGKSSDEAIIASASEVGGACVLTSITTFLGFICLAVVPTPALRQMGVVMAIGAAAALLLTITLVPIALHYLAPAPTTGHKGVSRLFDKLLIKISDFAITRPKTIIVAFACVATLAVAGLFQLKMDTDLAKRFGEKTKVSQDHRYFVKHFSGTYLLEIVLSSKTAGAILDPEVLARVAALQQRIETDARVDKVTSLMTVIKKLHRDRGNAGEFLVSRMPEYAFLLESMDSEDLRRLVDEEKRSMRMLVWLNTGGLRDVRALGQKVEHWGRSLSGVSVAVEPTGLLHLLGGWLSGMIDGQRRGLGLSIGLITLAMIVGFRSLRVGLFSIIPNLFPLLVLGGCLGFIYDAVDSDTLAVALVAIGIGIDDTIHFLMRYRHEIIKGASKSESLRRTFRYAGRAIVLTTVVLVVGFVPLATSSYYSAKMLGTQLPCVLLIALLADLLLLPALIKVGWFGTIERTGHVSADKHENLASQPPSVGR